MNFWIGQVVLELKWKEEKGKSETETQKQTRVPFQHFFFFSGLR